MSSVNIFTYIVQWQNPLNSASFLIEKLVWNRSWPFSTLQCPCITLSQYFGAIINVGSGNNRQSSMKFLNSCIFHGLQWELKITSGAKRSNCTCNNLSSAHVWPNLQREQSVSRGWYSCLYRLSRSFYAMLCVVLYMIQSSKQLKGETYWKVDTPFESCVGFWWTSAFSYIFLMPCLELSQLSLCLHTSIMHLSSKQGVQLHKTDTGRVLNWLKNHIHHCPSWYLDHHRQFVEQEPEFTRFVNKDMLWPIARAFWISQKGHVVVTACIFWYMDICIELRTRSIRSSTAGSGRQKLTWDTSSLSKYWRRQELQFVDL